MNLEPAPRPSKWIFFATDAGLLIAAFIIVFFNAQNPYAPLPFVSAVVCVVLAAVIGAVPFLIDYAADSAEYVQQERLKTEEQVQRLHAATESLARAAAQIKAVEEAVHKTAHAAETLPYRMQEKLAEFTSALAETEDRDRESLEEELEELRAGNGEHLKAAAEKIHQVTADWTALEAASRKQLAAAEAAAAKLQHAAADLMAKCESRIASSLRSLEANPARVADAPPHPAAVMASSMTSPSEAKLKPHAAEPEVEPVSVTNETETEPEPAKAVVSEEANARKSRPPRRAKPGETPVAMPDSVVAETGGNDLAGTKVPTKPAGKAGAAEEGKFQLESPQAAVSSDGATRLLVTAYIGIGNKLFIRGEGPGLSWDKGLPMQFVSIGKWGWATDAASAPVRCELYKNDETAALTGEVIVPPGKHVEITALF